MKHTRQITGIAAALVCMVQMAFLPGAIAGQGKAEVADLITTGQWFFQGGSWSNTRVFQPDGTLYTINRPKETGTWKVDSKSVVITFANGSHNILLLPIKPEGTPGLDAKDKAMTVTQQPKTSATAPPPAPVAGTAPSTTAPFGEKTEVAVTSAKPAATPAPVVTQASQASSEMQQKAADLVKSYHNSLVIVSGQDGKGSGFVAKLGGTNYLVTNAHIAAGINGATFKALDGTSLQGGKASVATGADIFCMELVSAITPFEIMQGVEENAGIGDDVAVLGNADGADVINTIMGKIVGIGPSLVEVDAPFVPGNSGSPIIHLKSGKVIGVATYSVTRKYDAVTREKMATPTIRRFGYRLDSVKNWQAVNWRVFLSQAAEMEKIHELTTDLDDFFTDLKENDKVTRGRHTNPVIKDRIDQWIENKSHGLSASDAANVTANFISFLKIACLSDVNAASRDMTYDYFQRKLSDEQNIRNEMAKAFEQIKGIQK